MSPVRVDFYLLPSEQPHHRWLFACRLIEKAYKKNHKIYIHCANQQDAELLDELLWTFKEDSFIPHNLQGEGPEPPPPVQIGFEKEPRGFNDLLINLASDVPSYYFKFKRVIELVSNDMNEKEQSRSHYKFYRSQQCELYTHPIESSQ